MTNRRCFILSALLSASYLASGCSKFSSQPAASNAANNPAAPQLEQQLSCEDTITQDKLDQFNRMQRSSAMFSGLSFVRGTTPAECALPGGQHSQGFSSLAAVLKIKLGTTTSFYQATQSPAKALWYGDVAIETSSISDSDLRTIASNLRTQSGKTLTIAQALPNFDVVTLSDMPMTKYALASTAVGAEEVAPVSVLRFEVPDSIQLVFGQKLKDFEAANAAINFHSMSDGSVLVQQAKAGELVDFNQFKNTATPQLAVDDLANLWQRLQKTDGALADTTLPYLWMRAASLWFPSMKLDPQAAQSTWPEAFNRASTLWSHPGQATDDVGALGSLAALRFLLLLDPANSLAVYGQQLSQLAAFINTNAQPGEVADDEGPYQALMTLKVRNQLNAQQNSAFFNFASASVPLVGSASLALKDASQAFDKSKANADQLASVLSTAKWLQDAHKGDPVSQAIALVFAPGTDTKKLEQFKGFYDFMVANGRKDQAWDKTNDFVYTRNFSVLQTDLYRKLVEGLKRTSFYEKAFDKADDYFITRGLDIAHENALVSSFTWLSTILPADAALKKAEDYLFVKNLSPDDVLRIQNIDLWLVTTSHNLTALSEAEDLVITKQLTSEQTTAIKLAYDWLAYTPQGLKAVDKAEDYVINQHLSIDQINEMVQAGSWLEGSPVGAAGEVAKAEDYVINKKLTPLQVNVLGNAYLWLRDTSAKLNALTKAEDYVINRGLTPESFRKLTNAYAKYHAANDPQALEKAEKEALSEAPMFPEPAPPTPEDPGVNFPWPVNY